MTTLGNGYITIALESNGQFTIGTTGGDPGASSDENKDLLYGHASPGTSDTFIRVDGVSSDLADATASAVTETADSLSLTYTAGDIEVLQRLQIVTSPATGLADTVEIYFRVTNNGAGAHAVGLRTQLDTLLGSNDGAPFRIPSIGGVTTDLEFDNDAGTAGIADIPSQALVLDSLLAPAVISRLAIRDLGYRTPDRVVFGYWPISRGDWDYAVDPARSFTSDSSVITWRGYPGGSAISLASG